MVSYPAVQLGEAALVRVALHAPLDGPLVLGSVLAGTFDFRASQAASGPSSAAPRCIQVWPLALGTAVSPFLLLCLMGLLCRAQSLQEHLTIKRLKSASGSGSALPKWIQIQFRAWRQATRLHAGVHLPRMGSACAGVRSVGIALKRPDIKLDGGSKAC